MQAVMSLDSTVLVLIEVDNLTSKTEIDITYRLQQCTVELNNYSSLNCAFHFNMCVGI